ncbi:MAG TPA: FmdB family zinc ribbon protein [Candidatus Limnocylindria bacterium]|nr:FmdB family zinc ribbon protein [Candidatus Limnocylindria bacterium]
MPIYDYRCDHCGHVFSAVQSFKDEPLEKCPNCAKKPRRLLSMPAIVFKGSGWYKTDSRPAEKGSADGSVRAEQKGDGKTETKGETKGETKTDTKGESKSDKKSEKSETKATEKPAPKSDAAS